MILKILKNSNSYCIPQYVCILLFFLVNFIFTKMIHNPFNKPGNEMNSSLIGVYLIFISPNLDPRDSDKMETVLSSGSKVKALLGKYLYVILYRVPA